MKRKVLIGIGTTMIAVGATGLMTIALKLNDKWYTSECKHLATKHLAKTYILMAPQIREIYNLHGTTNPDKLKDDGAPDWIVEYCRTFINIEETLMNR